MAEKVCESRLLLEQAIQRPRQEEHQKEPALAKEGKLASDILNSFFGEAFFRSYVRLYGNESINQFVTKRAQSNSDHKPTQMKKLLCM